MYHVYVLYSKKFEKIYIGYSSNIDQRLKSHNDPGNRGWTKKYKPWILIYSEAVELKNMAILRERQLKSYRGRQFIKAHYII
jgi:putative endonuclease